MYPLLSRNSAKYAPSCPVMPVISATLDVTTEIPPFDIILLHFWVPAFAGMTEWRLPG
jgi:hypothetical protein